MKLSELKPKQGQVEIVGEITEIGETREFSKFGKAGRVATAMIQDSSGKMKLTLWNEQIDQVKVNDKIKVENGYVTAFKGEIQLNVGKFGNLTVNEQTPS